MTFEDQALDQLVMGEIIDPKEDGAELHRRWPNTEAGKRSGGQRDA